jgi:hypothetical protein
MISLSNIFVGFGLDHNAYLLKILSSSNKNKYYFIDALEKAGLVYGEILHSIIYKIFENISITIKGGYIYDWKKNVWSNDIVIDDLVSDINKVFHIISKNPSNCEVIIKGNNYLTNKHFESTIIGSVKTDNIDIVLYSILNILEENLSCLIATFEMKISGEITKKITLVGCAVSASAKAKIEKAGGKVL